MLIVIVTDNFVYPCCDCTNLLVFEKYADMKITSSEKSLWKKLGLFEKKNWHETVTYLAVLVFDYPPS